MESGADWKLAELQASEAVSIGTEACRRSATSGGVCRALVLGSCINVFISDLVVGQSTPVGSFQ